MRRARKGTPRPGGPPPPGLWFEPSPGSQSRQGVRSVRPGLLSAVGNTGVAVQRKSGPSRPEGCPAIASRLAGVPFPRGPSCGFLTFLGAGKALPPTGIRFRHLVSTCSQAGQGTQPAIASTSLYFRGAKGRRDVLSLPCEIAPKSRIGAKPKPVSTLGQPII